MHTFFPTPSDDDFPDGVPDDIDSQVSELLESVETEATHGRPPDSDPDVSSEAVDAESYWALSRTPLTSLVFTLPLVLAYEGGVLLLGRSSPRNGADVWLRHLLDATGFGSYFLLPLLMLLGLLAWHHFEHDRWRFSPTVLLGMLAECLLLSLLLVGLARLQNHLWPLEIADGRQGIFARLVGFCGAGLYEEVLFRLLLLPVVAWVCQRAGIGSAAACFYSVLLTSLLFSAAHYVGPMGDTFAFYSFTFRVMAGVFFATLFVLRGFGIAAGTHAAYDMLVGLL